MIACIAFISHSEFDSRLENAWKLDLHVRIHFPIGLRRFLEPRTSPAVTLEFQVRCGVEIYLYRAAPWMNCLETQHGQILENHNPLTMETILGSDKFTAAVFRRVFREFQHSPIQYQSRS